jgi:hypothetical protein
VKESKGKVKTKPTKTNVAQPSIKGLPPEPKAGAKSKAR